jgi:hypothetical protein
MLEVTDAVDTATMPFEFMNAPRSYYWFARNACVVVDEENARRVFVAGSLLGEFKPRERPMRYALLVLLSEMRGVHLGRLCEAFEVSDETLRRLRAAYKKGGVQAVIAAGPKGSKSKVAPTLQARIERMFEKGMSISEVTDAINKAVGRSKVGELRMQWAARKTDRTAETPAALPDAAADSPASSVERVVEVQTEVQTVPEPPVEPPAAVSVERVVEVQTVPEPPVEPPAAVSVERVVEVQTVPEPPVEPPAAPPADDESEGAYAEIEDAEPVSAPFVQHVGVWILIAMTHAMGLYKHAAALPGELQRPRRLALDAAMAALILGQRCVEGVRRLATPTAHVLLRAARAPSATWVRRVLGSLARNSAGYILHTLVARDLIRSSAADADMEDPPAIFYIDNHTRPYTGKHTLRKAWRMQDKRAVPGCTDYYVHDEDGRPLLRVDVPSNAPLTDFLSPIAASLRDALGPDARILIGFDRAGAFANQMASLRDDGIEFVTYERKPYPALPDSAFTGEFSRKEGDSTVTIRFKDSRMNLGKKRGRLRRIALRMEDGKQINLLAIGNVTPERAYDIARGRWNQENGFKHGTERWGQNQLDGRQVRPYDPKAIIPNPARRRLDRALAVARAREGKARNALARLSKNPAQSEVVKRELATARALVESLEAQRPELPTYAPVEQTELAGKLVQHNHEYKAVIDSLRIACAHAEGDLAANLASTMNRPAEAKRLLANLLQAPGSVRVHPASIVVTLLPAASKSELSALKELLREVTSRKLSLPGDPRERPLVFRLHK